MTDLEYTVQAAKAAGYQWETQKFGNGEKLVMVHQGHTFKDQPVFVSWDPVSDDRDALDLAARLGIVVQDTEAGAIATCIDIDGTEGRGTRIGNDRESARRFAIVQCAASAYQRGAA